MGRTSRTALLVTALFILGLYPIAASASKPLQVGDEAPDYLGRDGKGKVIHLSDYKGKVVVVTFWATWCGPCLKELPVLENVQRAVSPQVLRVFAVNWNEPPQAFRKITKALAAYQLTLVADADGRAAGNYGVKAIPHMLLIGKDGRITFINVGYGESELDEIAEEINKALAMSFAAPGETQPQADAPL